MADLMAKMGGGNSDMMADLMAKMGGGMGEGGGLAGLADMMKDPEAMQAAMAKGMEAMASNPEMLKGLEAMMGASPEVAEMLRDPSKLQEKVSEAMEMMNSDEGRDMQSKVMEEFQSVLNDPEKLKKGLEQFATNPMLKGMADSVPGLKQMLDDPEMMSKSIEEAQAALSQMGGLEGMQEKMAENVRQMMEGGGLEGGSDAMANLLKEAYGGLEGTDGDLQGRVREQLAAMLQDRNGGDGPAVDIDEF